MRAEDLSREDKNACIKACLPAPESCRRAWGCNDLSFLPF